MTQLEEIQKLYAKAKPYKIPKEPKEGQDQATLKITPLSLDETQLLDIKKDDSMSETSKNIKKLIAKSLGAKEEEVNISFEFLEELMSAIMDANNLSEADKKKTGASIKSFIEKKQEQIAEKKRKEKDDAKPSGEA